MLFCVGQGFHIFASRKTTIYIIIKFGGVLERVEGNKNKDIHICIDSLCNVAIRIDDFYFSLSSLFFF